MSTAIRVTRPKPHGPRTTSGRPDITLMHLAPARSTSSSLVTMHLAAMPGGVIGLVEPAKVSRASSDATCSWPAGRPGRIGARTLSRTACQLAPTEITRWPPRRTQSTRGCPRIPSSDAITSGSAVSRTIGAGRVVAIPAAGQAGRCADRSASPRPGRRPSEQSPRAWPPPGSRATSGSPRRPAAVPSSGSSISWGISTVGGWAARPPADTVATRRRSRS